MKIDRIGGRGSRLGLGIVSGCAAGTLLVACGADPSESPASRTDIGPLEARVSMLGDLTEVSWASGDLSDQRVPGPNTYWLRGTGILRAEDAAALRSRPNMEKADLPEVIADAPHVDVNCRKWVHSADLDTELSAHATKGFWNVQVYVCEDEDLIGFNLEGGSN